MTLSARSQLALDGVHPDLVRVVERAHERGASFGMTEGLRSLARQKKLLAEGRSRTLRSRHLSGHAIDFVARNAAGQLVYDENDMRGCARVFKKAAVDCEVPLEWGGDWKGFVDTPHLQLPWKFYPEDDAAEPVRVTPRELAKQGSRIAGASIEQKKDAGKAAGVSGGELALPPPPPKLGLTDIAGDLGAQQGAIETIEKFLLFVWGKGGLIAGVLTAFFVARMAWKAGWIGTWRAEDQSSGKTGA